MAVALRIGPASATARMQGLLDERLPRSTDWVRHLELVPDIDKQRTVDVVEHVRRTAIAEDELGQTVSFCPRWVPPFLARVQRLQWFVDSRNGRFPCSQGTTAARSASVALGMLRSRPMLRLA